MVYKKEKNIKNNHLKWFDKITIIGDVHGKIKQYEKLLNVHKDSDLIFQVGDFGFKEQHKWLSNNLIKDKHFIVFGNHDYYPNINKFYSALDYMNFDNKIYTIRGAKSIDKHLRKNGADWFEDEEIKSHEIWNEIISDVIEVKPEIIISHTCPNSISEMLFGYNQNDINNKSITTQAMQSIFEYHQPKYWIFGHHHTSKNTIINNTNFICLKELETITLKV